MWNLTLTLRKVMMVKVKVAILTSFYVTICSFFPRFIELNLTSPEIKSKLNCGRKNSWIHGRVTLNRMQTLLGGIKCTKCYWYMQHYLYPSIWEPLLLVKVSDGKHALFDVQLDDLSEKKTQCSVLKPLVSGGVMVSWSSIFS